MSLFNSANTRNELTGPAKIEIGAGYAFTNKSPLATAYFRETYRTHT